MKSKKSIKMIFINSMNKKTFKINQKARLLYLKTNFVLKKKLIKVKIKINYKENYYSKHYFPTFSFHIKKESFLEA